MRTLPSLLLTTLLLTFAADAAHAQALRAEVARPLSQASAALKAGRAGEALAKVREADAVGGKTGAEVVMIERMRAAAAQRAGDWGAAANALQVVFGRVSGAEAGQVAEQIASAYATMRNNAQAAQWVQKAQSLGNNSAQIRQIQAYLQGSSGDYNVIAKESAAAVAAAEEAGKRPDETDLLRLQDAQSRIGSHAGQAVTLEKLLNYYPKKDYWNLHLARLQRKSGFSGRFNFDVLRLKLATGNLTTTDEYMEAAQLALQAGLPAEARTIVDKGFAAGALGTGAEAARHQRLKDLVLKQEAEAKASLAARANEAAGARDGNDLVQLGNVYVSFGEVAKGTAMIEQGIAKGGLKRPEDAKLRLGQAMVLDAKTRAKGLHLLRSIQGSDGVADVAKLWALHAANQG